MNVSVKLYTVQVKHPSKVTISKTHFGVEGDLNDLDRGRVMHDKILAVIHQPLMSFCVTIWSGYRVKGGYF